MFQLAKREVCYKRCLTNGFCYLLNKCTIIRYILGMIEMVTNAETLRKIQVELGLTGSFKDRPIAEWLAKHNPSALEYERAVANFTG